MKKKNIIRINEDVLELNSRSCLCRIPFGIAHSCWAYTPPLVSQFPKISSQVAWFNDQLTKGERRDR